MKSVRAGGGVSRSRVRESTVYSHESSGVADGHRLRNVHEVRGRVRPGGVPVAVTVPMGVCPALLPVIIVIAIIVSIEVAVISTISAVVSVIVWTIIVVIIVPVATLATLLTRLNGRHNKRDPPDSHHQHDIDEQEAHFSNRR